MDSTWSAAELGAHARALPRRACLAFGPLKAGWLRQTFVHWPFRPADVQVLRPTCRFSGRRAGSSAPWAAGGRVRHGVGETDPVPDGRPAAGGCADQDPLHVLP